MFDLMVRGKINKQIAYELGTTERTVKAHRHQVMEKMQVNSLAEVVSIAERLAAKMQYLRGDLLKQPYLTLFGSVTES